MSNTRKGKHHSEEHKRKLSEAGKQRWKKYREKEQTL
jgi:hypothetical protein